MPIGIIEVARDLEVTIPANSKPGAGRGAVVLETDDTPDRMLDIEWTVSPHLRVSPSGLVISSLGGNGGSCRRSVIIQSDGHPFRWTTVSGPRLLGRADPPHVAASSHRLELTFDTTARADREVFDVRIETDHPEQPVVLLGVLILKDTK